MNFTSLCYSLLVIISSLGFSVFAETSPLPISKVMHITVPLSDRLSTRYEKYLLYAYNQLGYKVIFEKILIARAREMVGSGRLDGMMIAEKEIEQVYHDLLRVPVVLAKGSLVLYCKKELRCDIAVLNDMHNIVGVISGHSISANFMKKMSASIYELKSAENLGIMLSKGRLDYVLIVNEAQLGNIGDLDESQYQQAEIYRTEAYHYIHKKHAKLIPQLTESLQAAIKKYGPLVKRL